MNDIELFWQRTNKLIRDCNYTQSSLSVTCNFNEKRIQNLSAGKRLPDAFEVVAIAKALNTTVEYLVTGKHPEQEKSVNNLKNDILKAVSDIFSKY